MSAKSTAAECFRANVWHQMAQRNLTITKMATEIGMSRPGLSRVLHGHEDVTFDRADRIAAYFGRNLRDFLRLRKNISHSA